MDEQLLETTIYIVDNLGYIWIILYIVDIV